MKTYYGIHTDENGKITFEKVEAGDLFHAYNLMERNASTLNIISQKQLETLWNIHKTLKEGEIKEA